ncbi:hypothetical protein LRL17_31330 (plasmid) [Rhodococcus qingshengii]|uniref:hypothetical protein n=1 Tax=Rhodococcus qingshengii TaxID=334542 RepID=UPI001E638BC1|nr:hypothetical protein [Rhodococcus qingshengii]UGQ55438.1 hypothetical protein LRL17_31330 [Rhodococcus qingshengii]
MRTRDRGYATRTVRVLPTFFTSTCTIIVHAVRLDEPATVQLQVPQAFRDRPASNNDAVSGQFERNP